MPGRIDVAPESSIFIPRFEISRIAHRRRPRRRMPLLKQQLIRQRLPHFR
jgi:hypothetical protein